MTVVNRIKIIAAKRGLSLTDIERQSGLTIRTIYKWDKNSPSVDKALAVANFLNVSLYWLFTGEEENHSNEDDIYQRYKLLSEPDKEKIRHFIDISLMHTLPTGRSSTNRLLAVLGSVGGGTPIQGINVPITYLAPPGTIHADYALIAEGNSMAPIIQEGEYIFVQNSPTLEPDDIGIFYRNGALICGIYDQEQDYKIQGKVVLTEEQRTRYI